MVGYTKVTNSVIALACISMLMMIALPNALAGSPLERLLNSPVVDEKLITRVNSQNHGWIASPNNRFANITLRQAQRLCGTWVNQTSPNTHLRAGQFQHYSNEVIASLPISFDARERWGHACPSVTAIRDQGNCGSCWAVSAASAITDRICLENGGRSNRIYSAADPLACCQNCGMGCNGGYINSGFDYWVSEGLVTGDEYGTIGTCYPYPIADCKNRESGNFPVGACTSDNQTPTCPNRCDSQYTNNTWTADKSRGIESYQLPHNIDQIKAEIYTRGPVVAAYTVYSDFMTYKSGVYSHVSGNNVGGHAVKVLGWGVENGKNYWLVANSWGPQWGLDGYFKYIRGTNEGGFEGSMYAGIGTRTPSPSPETSTGNAGLSSSSSSSTATSTSSSSSSAPNPVTPGSSSQPTPIPDDIKDLICKAHPDLCPYL